MALTAEWIAGQPALYGLVRRQSQGLLLTFEQNPRVASVFATQQRWLLAHAGLALYFRRDPADKRGGLVAARFLELVSGYDVASRNTADAFLKEMLKYGMVRRSPAGTDRRIRALEPGEPSIAALTSWAAAHLATLDGLDGGGRLTHFRGDPQALSKLQPLIADGLLTSAAVRQPRDTFSLFTWLNNGGVVMDRLIAGIEVTDPEAERVPTGVLSIAEMAGWLRLSRTHLARKLREAEALGSIGWVGRRGNSVMWVSKAFRREYATAQAVKLAIVDAACDACFGTGDVATAAAPARPELQATASC
jgi:hypothetical protein